MRGRIHKALAAGLVATAACLPRVASAQPADVTSEQVANAVQKGVAFLRNTPAGGGGRGNWQAQGTLALTMLAMINAGVPPDDPAVAKGLAAVADLPDEHTYVVGLKIQALAAADPKKYARQIQDAANWLIKYQFDNGTWTYTAIGTKAGSGDNSNTQFAILGLHEAAKAGAKVPPQAWERSRKHFENTQSPDGGWGYVSSAPGYGSMTAAGLASLFICGQRLMEGGPKQFVNGAYPSCGRYQQNVRIAKGLEWMTKNFAVDRNPPNRRQTWLYYYLYGMERVGMVSGLRSFGQHDWYRQGAAFLVSSQRPDGGWGNAYDTAFAVLFLAKGNRPVLVQKVAWNDDAGKAGRWNRNIHDLENLTAFLGDKLGKPVTWQTTGLELPLQQLRTSPVLFITGHEFPAFTPAERAKLRGFVDSGGTLLFEACCGMPRFRDGFREFAKEVFAEYELRPLAADHPVFRSLYDLQDTYGLEGIDVGCRTSVFFSPRALSCLWELQTIKDHSEKAFRLGGNIAAYATGREALANKLDVVTLPESAKPAGQPSEVPRGAVRIARLRHPGDYAADPHALVNLAAMLRDRAKVDVVSRERHIEATDEKLYDYPVLFMTGHFEFELSDVEVEALRKYLQRGGVLVADACCGQKPFDTSFRRLVKQLFPEDDLRPLPADHPIYTGQVGVSLGEVKYRRVLAEELKARGTTRPPLEAVTLRGRTAVLYSKYDWSCALEGDNPFSCRGYADADGQKLALNILLYAISY